MKIIKLLGKILYVIIIFIILIYGIIGIGEVLSFIGIQGSLNYMLQFILAIYGLSMFCYDVDRVYNEKDNKKE